MKKLETERLIIREIELNDAEEMFDYAKTEFVGPKAGWLPHKTIFDTIQIIRLMISEKETWGIKLKNSLEFIGTISLTDRSENDLVKKEIGYALSHKHWKKGYATEATNRVIEHAFDDLDVDVLRIGHSISNFASERVINKFNFKLKEHKLVKGPDGILKEIAYYEMTKDDYKEGIRK